MCAIVSAHHECFLEDIALLLVCMCLCVHVSACVCVLVYVSVCLHKQSYIECHKFVYINHLVIPMSIPLSPTHFPSLSLPLRAHKKCVVPVVDPLRDRNSFVRVAVCRYDGIAHDILSNRADNLLTQKTR